MSSNKISELQWINPMKGLAILWILMVHYGYQGISNDSIITVIRNGDRGVQLFFIISAFLAYLSLSKRFCYERISVKEYIRWIKHKLFRLLPLYYFAIGLSLFVFGSYKTISLSDLLVHLFFLHGFFPNYLNDIIKVEWYIGALVIFYLFVPILFKYINNLKRSITLFCFSVLICYIVRCVFFNTSILNLFIKDTSLKFAYITSFGILAEIPTLFLGIVLFYIVNNRQFSALKGEILLGLGILALSIASFASIQLLKTVPVFGHEIWGISFVGIILGTIILKCPKVINNTVFNSLGKYSYGIYLLQIVLLQKMPKIDLSNDVVNWIVNYVIILLSTLIASITLHYVLERPFNRIFNLM